MDTRGHMAALSKVKSELTSTCFPSSPCHRPRRPALTAAPASGGAGRALAATFDMVERRVFVGRPGCCATEVLNRLVGRNCFNRLIEKVPWAQMLQTEKGSNGVMYTYMCGPHANTDWRRRVSRQLVDMLRLSGTFKLFFTERLIGGYVRGCDTETIKYILGVISAAGLEPGSCCSVLLMKSSDSRVDSSRGSTPPAVSHSEVIFEEIDLVGQVRYVLQDPPTAMADTFVVHRLASRVGLETLTAFIAAAPAMTLSDSDVGHSVSQARKELNGHIQHLADLFVEKNNDDGQRGTGADTQRQPSTNHGRRSITAANQAQSSVPRLDGVLPKRYVVFISHAGPDKHTLAIPLYNALTAKRVSCFVDKVGLRPGYRGVEKMKEAMENADVGVFITSPEFAGREWTLRELICFLDRVKEAKNRGMEGPTILPVFYRLGVHECRSDSLYDYRSDTGRVIFDQGFFEEQRQAEVSTSKARTAMRELASFTGIENEEVAPSFGDWIWGGGEEQRQKEALIERVAGAVMEALGRKGGGSA